MEMCLKNKELELRLRVLRGIFNDTFGDSQRIENLYDDKELNFLNLREFIYRTDDEIFSALGHLRWMRLFLEKTMEFEEIRRRIKKDKLGEAAREE